MDVDVKHIMKHHATQDIPLTFDEAYALGCFVLEGCRGNSLAQIQSTALLCALHNKATYLWQKDELDNQIEKRHGHRLPEDASEQIAGICAATLEHDISKSEFGFLEPEVDFVADNCGMGGDLVPTPNVSTIAAFIAAAAGMTICKHGSPANTDQGECGSSDFISHHCRINTFARMQEVLASVCQLCFGYTEALDTRYKLIHTQTHRVAQLAHMNDIIGPVTNPIHPKLMTRRVLGVNHLIPPLVVAKAYKYLNERGTTFLQHGLFVRGLTSSLHDEGIDEISICEAGTQVVELKDGIITGFNLYAEDFGIEPILVGDILPKGNKGEYSLALLKGEVEGPPLSFVLANAAVLFYVYSRQNHDWKECYRHAEETFRHCDPYKKMLAVREALPK